MQFSVNVFLLYMPGLRFGLLPEKIRETERQKKGRQKIGRDGVKKKKQEKSEYQITYLMFSQIFE